MSTNKDYGNLSRPVIDMLVDSTLKKHGVELETKKLDAKEKEALKNMVNNLMNSVESLNQDQKKKAEKENE